LLQRLRRVFFGGRFRNLTAFGIVWLERKNSTPPGITKVKHQQQRWQLLNEGFT